MPTSPLGLRTTRRACRTPEPSRRNNRRNLFRRNLREKVRYRLSTISPLSLRFPEPNGTLPLPRLPRIPMPPAHVVAHNQTSYLDPVLRMHALLPTGPKTRLARGRDQAIVCRPLGRLSLSLRKRGHPRLWNRPPHHRSSGGRRAWLPEIGVLASAVQLRTYQALEAWEVIRRRVSWAACSSERQEQARQ